MTNTPQVINRAERPLPEFVDPVLEKMFAQYREVIVLSEFTNGLSGSHVFLVRPIRYDGPELPSVVKIDRQSAITREWQAYQEHIQRRLPGIAKIHGDPVSLPEKGWSGLWYPFIGDNLTQIDSFYGYYQHASTQAIQSILKKQLFRCLAELWKDKELKPEFHVQTFYDSFLPMNLVIDCRTDVSATIPVQLTPQNIHTHTCQVGDVVQLSGFRVARVALDHDRLSLDIPREQTAAYRMHIFVDNATDYEEEQILTEPLTGVITETRADLLQAQVQKAMGGNVDVKAASFTTADGLTLPNPLVHLPRLLQRTFDAYVTPIHGDLNLQNVLIERQNGQVRLIDFAKSGRNHVLRDFICLELGIVTQLLPLKLDAVTGPKAIIPLYQQLHCAMHLPGYRANLSHIGLGLEKPFAVLQTLRQGASHYLCKPDNWTEYYAGLIIYLLGALKFSNLDKMANAPWPKQLAFWGAAMTQKLLDDHGSLCQETRPPIPTTPARSRDSWANYEKGLKYLREHLQVNHPTQYGDLLTYEQRLIENLNRTRRFGDTSTRRADRSEIIDELNRLALDTIGLSFNQLCE